MKTQFIAHRGLYEGFVTPENSILAFKKAIRHNYAIELDLRITKDKKIVVFHDKHLFRMCGIDKKLKNINSKDLKNIFLYDTKEQIPFFNDVLRLVNGRVPLIIEIKNESKVGKFEKIVAELLDNYKGEFSICSFNEDVVHWFKENRANFKRGLIFTNHKKSHIDLYKLHFLYKFLKASPDYISLDYKLRNTLIVDFCRKLDLPIFSWTINSMKKYEKSKHIFDNLIFENIRL